MTTSLNIDLNQHPIPNQPYTVEVTVTSASSTPTGTVTISDGENSCLADLTEAEPGVAIGACQLVSSSSGAKTITATYSGDTNYASGDPVVTDFMIWYMISLPIVKN